MCPRSCSAWPDPGNVRLKEEIDKTRQPLDSFDVVTAFRSSSMQNSSCDKTRCKPFENIRSPMGDLFARVRCWGVKIRTLHTLRLHHEGEHRSPAEPADRLPQCRAMI